MENKIYAIRTTANREEQVMDFIDNNVKKKKLEVYSLINAHGMRGYIFIESKTEDDAKQACFGIPYSKRILLFLFSTLSTSNHFTFKSFCFR